MKVSKKILSVILTAVMVIGLLTQMGNARVNAEDFDEVVYVVKKFVIYDEYDTEYGYHNAITFVSGSEDKLMKDERRYTYTEICSYYATVASASTWNQLVMANTENDSDKYVVNINCGCATSTEVIHSIYLSDMVEKVKASTLYVYEDAVNYAGFDKELKVFELKASNILSDADGTLVIDGANVTFEIDGELKCKLIKKNNGTAITSDNYEIVENNDESTSIKRKHIHNYFAGNIEYDFNQVDENNEKYDSKYDGWVVSAKVKCENCDNYEDVECSITRIATVEEATCTKKGKIKIYTSAELDNWPYLYDKTVDTSVNTNHSWNSGDIIEKATAQKQGQIKYTCTECNSQKIEKYSLLLAGYITKEGGVAAESMDPVGYVIVPVENYKELNSSISYDNETNTLTFNNFTGYHVSLYKDNIKIVLNGTNTIKNLGDKSNLEAIGELCLDGVNASINAKKGASLTVDVLYDSVKDENYFGVLSLDSSVNRSDVNGKVVFKSTAQDSVELLKQTITVSSSFKKIYGNPDFSLGAKTSGDGTLTYSSNNKNVVTVDKNGKVRITGSGNAIITITAAKTDKYQSAAKNVTIIVDKATQKITTSKSAYTALVGDKAFNINANSLGDGKLTYKSSNTKVVTVSSNGIVTIKGAGKATITINAVATTKYNNATKNVTITINKITQKIACKKTSISKKIKDKSFKLGCSAKTTITYKSSNKKVAIVSSKGVVSIKGKGKATITVTAKSTAKYKSATKKITLTVK